MRANTLPTDAWILKGAVVGTASCSAEVFAHQPCGRSPSRRRRYERVVKALSERDRRHCGCWRSAGRGRGSYSREIEKDTPDPPPVVRNDSGRSAGPKAKRGCGLVSAVEAASPRVASTRIAESSRARSVMSRTRLRYWYMINALVDSRPWAAFAPVGCVTHFHAPVGCARARRQRPSFTLARPWAAHALVGSVPL